MHTIYTIYVIFFFRKKLQNLQKLIDIRRLVQIITTPGRHIKQHETALIWLSMTKCAWDMDQAVNFKAVSHLHYWKIRWQSWKSLFTNLWEKCYIHYYFQRSFKINIKQDIVIYTWKKYPFKNKLQHIFCKYVKFFS